MNLGDNCPRCKRKITKQVISKIKKSKRDNALRSLRLAKLSGKIGRPKVRDDIQIRILRSKGLTIRAIAKEVGLSTAAVHRGLK